MSRHKHDMIALDGLHACCDKTDGCGWTSGPIKGEDLHRHIEAPCPECGRVYVTAKDVRKLEHMLATIHRVNKFLRPFVAIARFTGLARDLKPGEVARGATFSTKGEEGKPNSFTVTDYQREI